MIILIHGDAFEEIKKIKKESINCIVTDIPYLISKESNFDSMKDRTGRIGLSFGDWDKEFNLNELKNFPELLEKNGSIVLFHSFEQFSEIKGILEENGMIFKDKIIWKKTNPMPRNRDRRYISNCEIASWYVKKGSKWTFNRQNEKYQQMIFEFPAESGGGFKRYHPTQKNLKLIEEIIKIHTNTGDIVLDCFMGSGTTGIACKRLNRKFIGIELKSEYYEIAKNRLGW